MPKINYEEYEVLKELDDEWKWIARDDDLSVYDDKPVKAHSVIPCWDIRTTKNEWQIINRNLFQFIQWEDEEPHNIAELIEEYEEHEFYNYVGWEYYKNEETEVKKNLIDAILNIEVTQFDGQKTDLGELLSQHKLSAVLDQLDEPEVNSQIDKLADFIMSEVEGEPSRNQGAVDTAIRIIKSYQNQETLSQEWIDENKVARINNLRKMTMDDVVSVDKLQNLLVPKQELPVIPQFVAEYLDFAKSDVPLMRVLELANTRNELPKWEKEYDWISANDEKFARAWLDGYEVEKEQKYYVINNDQRMMLVRKMDGKTITEADPFKLEDMYEVEKKSHRLTEQEIKDYDERYWAFTKPVKELEE